MRRVHIKQAEDIYDVMYPIFIISKILGLAPFQYNRKGQKSYTAHFGVITILRYILILGVMCYICFVMDDINFSVNIGGMALRYELYFGTIMTAIILLLAITNQKLLIDAIHKITEIDEDFKNMGREVTYKNAQIFSYLQILFMISMFSCKAILQPFSNDLAYFVIYSIFNVIDFINTGMLFQFVDLLLLIRQRFIWINREIRNLTSFSRKISTIGETVEINQLMQVHPKNSDFKSVIKSLGKIQNKLYFVCKVTNRNYGMQLLVTVTIRFIMITTQLINTYKVIQDPRLAGSVTHSLIAIYLFFNFTKLFMVCALSTNTAAKGRDTGIYLHTLWDITDEENDRVQFFSLQILQQDIHFTACGFFKIDFTLIYAIVGAVTTYLVILIQFDLAKMDVVTCNISVNNMTAVQI